MGEQIMNIYVGNLSLELTEDELRKEFSVFGQVKSVYIMNDMDIGSGQLCGYGFVEMVSETEGSAAITSIRGRTIKGRVIEAIESLCFSGYTDKKSLDSRRGNRFNRIRQHDTRKKLNRMP